MDEALLYKIDSRFSHAKELGADKNHSDLVTEPTINKNVAFFPHIIIYSAVRQVYCSAHVGPPKELTRG